MPPKGVQSCTNKRIYGAALGSAFACDLCGSEEQAGGKELEVQEKHCNYGNNISSAAPLASAASPLQQQLCVGQPSLESTGQSSVLESLRMEKTFRIIESMNPEQPSPAVWGIVALTPKKRSKSTSKNLGEFSKFLTAFLWVWESD